MRLLPTVFLLGLALHSPVSARPGVQRQPIIDGTPSLDDDAVAAILVDGRPVCTGTLVHDDVVLTAAHCLVSAATSRYAVSFGGAPGAVTDQLRHPDFDPVSLDADLALLRLARPAAVPPARLNKAPMSASWVGRPVRIVGFGAPAFDRPSVFPGRHQTREVITAVDDARFRYGEATCHGDSGGPAFARIGAEELLVGVTSSGPAYCRHYGRSTRVDAQLGWIERGMEELTEPGGCSLSGGPTGERLPLSLALLLLGYLCVLQYRSKSWEPFRALLKMISFRPGW